MIEAKCKRLGVPIFDHERSYFFHNKVLLGQHYVWFYIMLYLGSLARHKEHGMQRIDYSILLEYDGKPFKFAMHQFYMYLRRLLTCLIVLAPCYTAPVLALEYINDGEYKFKWYSHLLHILLLNLTNFILFYYFEYVCFKQQNETNQFELISQSDVNQIMQNMINKQYENINDLDTSQEYEETKRGMIKDIQIDLENELDGESDQSSRFEEAAKRTNQRDTDDGQHKMSVKGMQYSEVASAKSFDRKSVDNSSLNIRSNTVKRKKKMAKDKARIQMQMQKSALAVTAVDYN